MSKNAKEFLKGQPLYVKTIWWSMTILLVICMLPWVGIALLNPFWFRNSFFDLIEYCTECLASKRDGFLEPVMSKYKLFDTIKGS